MKKNTAITTRTHTHPIVIAIAWKALELVVLQRSGIIQQWIYVVLVSPLSVDSYYCFNLLAVVDLFKSFIFGWLNLDRYLPQVWVKVREDPLGSGTHQQNER